MGFRMDALNRATHLISRVFRLAGQDMGFALERIASGSRINRPSDDFEGFGKTVTLLNEVKTFQSRAGKIREDAAVVQQAMDLANQIYDDLVKMQAALQNSDNQLARSYGASIEQALTLTSHDGTKLINKDLVEDLGIIAATGAELKDTITITDFTGGRLPGINQNSNLQHVTQAIDEAQTYIKEITGLHSAMQSQAALADTMVLNSESVSRAVISVDEAAETAKFVEADIRQQAALSMLAQANMSRRNVEMLYRQIER